MNKSIINVFSFLIVLFFTNVLFSQNQLRGKVLGKNNEPISSAIIVINGGDDKIISNNKGAFVLEYLQNEINLEISRLGYKTLIKSIDATNKGTFIFVLEELYENLNTVVVTGTFEGRKQLESSTSVSVLSSDELKKLVPRGTADLLRNIPGTFVDASAGEVFTKVYSRGVSASAEDDLGWYYTSLQEDGLPVSLIQHSYYGSDLFYRSDITTERVEAIRGGSAAITAMNAPGGIYNFISSDKTEEFGGQAQMTTGFQGENNLYSKYEFIMNGDFGNKWFYNAGGHYRKDEGARNVDFTFSQGGQVKLNIIKQNDFGYFKFYTKVLHDNTNRWNGVTASNWENPTEAYGQDFNTTSQLLPSINATIPDGRYLDEQKTNSFNPSNGVLAKDLVFGFDFSQTLGNDWSVKNNVKFSDKSANWQSTISNAFVGLGDITPYYVMGYSHKPVPNFPTGNIVFRDANSGALLAEVDNTNTVNFSGGYSYNSGSLPNDGILGAATWYKNTKSTEVMDHLVLNKKWENHNFNTGADFGYASTEHYTQSNFVFATYENNPRAMVVTLENGGDVVHLSDENGISNYGGLIFENATAKLYQAAVFVNDLWDVTDHLQLDAGFRFENILHQGDKYRSEPFSQDGGYDGNALTDYDNGILQPNGTKDQFDFNYQYFSYSIGVNYKIQDDLILFGRSSKGNKAPEFDYYFNNFTNVPIPKKGEIQQIYQSEIGLKYNKQNVYVSGTAFLSELHNIGTTDFNFDEETNTISYTPTQFNDARTVGLELESMYKPADFLRFNVNGVLQSSKSKEWTVYDSETQTVIGYNNKKLPHNPNLMFNVKTTYEEKNFYAFFDAKYMGERQGNIANGFTLPSYITCDLGAGYAFNNNLNLSANVTNVFNSDGLAGFYGPNTFGGNANQVTAEYVAANPDQNFIVVPILPRGMFLKLNYQF